MAHHALDRAAARWHEMDMKRREMMSRGRRKSAELVHAWEEAVAAYKASLAEARREWRQAARLLADLPQPA